jgi:predicted nucleic acid-binding protein
MIYADASFLASLYGWDDNTQKAEDVYSKDGRRPLCFTPWQRLEVRNAIRLSVHKARRAGRPVRFQVGNLLKRMDEDLSAGRLKHFEPDWREAFRLAEDLSAEHTEATGCASVDLWHVASANLLGADTFWTFDELQQKLAETVGCFRRVPRLTA